MKETKINKIIQPFDGVRRKTAHTTPERMQESPAARGTFRMFGKITSAVLAVFVLALALPHVGGTISYFDDAEASLGNFLKADPLGFSVILATSSARVDVSEGEQTIVPEMQPDADSEPVQYYVRAKITGGDPAFCASIHVLGTYPFPYDGRLADISTGTSTAYGSWALTVSVSDPGALAPNAWCSVDLIYKGWNAGVPEGRGFKDIETIPVMFYVPETYAPPAPPAAAAQVASDAEEPSDADAGAAASQESEQLLQESSLEESKTGTEEGKGSGEENSGASETAALPETETAAAPENAPQEVAAEVLPGNGATDTAPPEATPGAETVPAE